jgi:hypothetical protein
MYRNWINDTTAIANLRPFSCFWTKDHKDANASGRTGSAIR